MKRNRTLGIVTRVACVLLCLVLFSAHLCSGMFARYNTKGEAESSARVAGLNVNVTQQEALSVADSGVATYSFIVNNESEVAVTYGVEIKFKTNSDAIFDSFGDDALSKVIRDVKIGDDLVATVSDDGRTYTFNSLGSLEPGESSDPYDLSYVIHVIAKNNGEISPNYQTSAYGMSFDVFAKAVQID